MRKSGRQKTKRKGKRDIRQHADIHSQNTQEMSQAHTETQKPRMIPRVMHSQSTEGTTKRGRRGEGKEKKQKTTRKETT